MESTDFSCVAFIENVCFSKRKKIGPYLIILKSRADFIQTFELSGVSHFCWTFIYHTRQLGWKESEPKLTLKFIEQLLIK